MMSTVKESAEEIENINGQNSINQSNCGDKSLDDPVEILRSLTDETKTGSNKSTTKPNSPTSSASSSAINPSSGPTPPPSGTSSKSVPIPRKGNASIAKMFETFYQSPSGEFKPTFYNPFEVRHRRRTSRSQFKTLERAFIDNCKPSAFVRKTLAQELNMSARSIQVWFQNRRAKLKAMLKNGKLTDKQMMEYLNQQNQTNNFDECDMEGDQEEEEDGGGDGEEEDDDTQESPNSFEDSETSETENNNNGSRNKKNSNQKSNLKQNSNVFTLTERRRFPSNSKAVPISGVNINGHETEIMSYADSYPNQARNRSYSLPLIQRSPQLPFKQLQDALFGSNTSGNPFPVELPMQSHIQEQLQAQVQIQAHNQPHYNTSLNAFQHYYRASNAAMTQVCNNPNPALMSQNQNYYTAPQGQIQLHFTPLNQPVEYQVDPNRFRPRSSSFAFGQQRTPSGSGTGNNNELLPGHSSYHNYDMLSVIKEDSPISEYMSTLPPNSYFDGNEPESCNLSNQIHSLDLDYFMSSANGNDNYSHHQDEYYSNSSSSSVNISNPNSPILIDNSESRPSSNCRGNNGHNYINELAFLPQPTSEILLSTLIDDEHFLQ